MRLLGTGKIKDKASKFARQTLRQNRQKQSGPRSAPPHLIDLRRRASAPPPGNKPLGVEPTMNPSFRSRKILRFGLSVEEKDAHVLSPELGVASTAEDSDDQKLPSLGISDEEHSF